jgi:hypothetical protein
MLLDTSATKAVALVLAAAISQPAIAQVGMAPPAAPPPSTWTVTPDAARGLVQISATATDGSTLFVGGCNKLAEPGFIGAFSHYGGGKLRTDGGNERALFEVSGAEWKEAFAVQLHYVADSGSWEIVGAIAPVFLASFSRGGQLTVLNGQQQKVFAFDLTGSTAATRTMRDVCGLQ